MSTMDFAGVERAYEQLAVAIDQAGRAHESLFLARLALLLAEQCGDVAVFEACLAAALEDLPARSDPA